MKIPSTDRPRLIAERFVERMTPQEYDRAARVSRALPFLADNAVEAAGGE